MEKDLHHHEMYRSHILLTISHHKNYESAACYKTAASQVQENFSCSLHAEFDLRLLYNILLDPDYKVGYSGEFPDAQLPYSQSVATVWSKTYIAPISLFWRLQYCLTKDSRIVIGSAIDTLQTVAGIRIRLSDWKCSLGSIPWSLLIFGSMYVYSF